MLALPSPAYVWVKRAAAKSVLAFMARGQTGAAAANSSAAVSTEELLGVLDGAAKGDFVCARWAREAHKWQQQQQQLASMQAAGGGRRKKWFED